MVSECQDETAFNGVAEAHLAKYDVVIDATGSPAGLSLAAGMCRAMGTVVRYLYVRVHCSNKYTHIYQRSTV